jgi:hypothetical protein
VPLFLWLILVVRADGWAVIVLMVAGITDWLDGFLARRWHQVSWVGQMLDPVADRLLHRRDPARPRAAERHPVVPSPCSCRATW